MWFGKNEKIQDGGGGHFEKRRFLTLSPKNREGHNCLFSRASSKVPKTTKKLKFVSNGHGIQGYDPTSMSLNSYLSLQ